MHVSRFFSAAAAATLLMVGSSSAAGLPQSPNDKYMRLAKRKAAGDLSSSSLSMPMWMQLDKRTSLPDVSEALSFLESIIPGLNATTLKGNSSLGDYSLAGIPLNNTASLNQDEINRARACPSIEFITTRGANDSYTDGYWLHEMARQVMSRLPNGTARRTETNYDSNIGNDLSSQLNAATAGSWWVANYTTLLAQTCPNTTIIMMAYSLGAAANVVASTRPRFPASRVAAAVYWGSPLRSPGRPQNRGDATSALGQVALLGYRTPRGMEPRVRDYCVRDDIICTNFGSLASHLSYANSTIQDETVEFLVQSALQA